MEKLLVIKEIFRLLFDSSSDEDSDEEIGVTKNTAEIHKRHCKNTEIVRARNDDSDENRAMLRTAKAQKHFAEDIVPTLTAKSFRQHFRVSPDVFEIICKDIYPFLHKKYGKGRNPVKLDKQVMITLSYLGNKEGLRSISDRFDISIATAWRIVSSVCDAIKKLNEEKKIVKWPSRQEAEKTAKYYYSTYKLKGVIGCTTSCHVKIRAPLHVQKAYINKNGTHSILLQAVSNENLQFVHFYIGECGSLDDATLLAKSGLEAKIDSGILKMTEDQHLMGDTSYPLKPWLITPYRNADDAKYGQILFNKMHAKCIDDINNSFWLLKGRFRRLQYIDCLRTAAATKFIAASCILHNICIFNEDFSDDDVEIEIEDNEKEWYEETECSSSTANVKRNFLMDMLHDTLAELVMEGCSQLSSNIRRIASFLVLDLETNDLPYVFSKIAITEMCLYGFPAHELEAEPGESRVNESRVPKRPRILHKLTMLFNPRRLINPSAEQITGLSNYNLENESHFDENACNAIISFIKHMQQPVCLVAHNGDFFDFPIVKQTFDKLKLEMPEGTLCLDSLRAFWAIDERLKSETTNSTASPISVFQTDSVVDIEVSQKSEAYLDTIPNDGEKILDAVHEDEGAVLEYSKPTLKQQLAVDTKIDWRTRNETTPSRPTEAGMKRNYSNNLKPAKNKINDNITFKAKRALFTSKKVDRYPPKGIYKLGNMYERHFKEVPKTMHYAEADVETLMHLMKVYGINFLAYAENHAIPFSDVKMKR